MGEITHRRVAGAAITAMVVAGIVGVTSLSVSGQTTPPPVEATDPLPPVPYGTLTIDLTDRVGRYTLVDPDGVDIVPPETIITSQPCAAVAPGSGRLLVLTPNPASPTSAADTVQIRDSSLGVNTNNTSCGSSAAAVLGRNEQLKIELGSLIPEGVFAKSASLQLVKLRSGSLQWKVDNGALSSAISISQNPQQVSVSPGGLFSSITIASNSRRDNEGLSLFDGTSFELVGPDTSFEVAVDCGEKVTDVGDAGDVADTVVYLRGQNDLKAEGVACQDVGVIVEVQTEEEAGADDDLGGRVYWDNSFTGVDGTTPQAVQGTVSITWAPVFIDGLSQAEIEEILDRQIDYDGPGLEAGFTDTLWCLSFTDESNFTLPPAEVPAGETAAPGANDDGTAPWCLVEDERVLTNVLVDVTDPVTGAVTTESKPAIIQTEVLAGKGDPWRL